MLQRIIPSLAITLLLAACTTQAEVTESGAEFQLASSSASSAAVQSIAVTETFLSGGLLHIGNSDADVELTLYLNHASPYSKQFHDTFLPRLVDEFVTKGLLQIQMTTVSFAKYPQSKERETMFLCGAIQGKGIAMSDLLFAQQNLTLLQKQITSIGLDMPRYQACVKAPPAKATTDVTVVPAYDINGKRYTGLPEYADLRGQINNVMDR